jgi:hypothetical protein
MNTFSFNFKATTMKQVLFLQDSRLNGLQCRFFFIRRMGNTRLSVQTLLLILLAFLVFSCSDRQPKPLCLNPKNQHYFLFRKKPMILIGSTEHYGACMNLDFDYNVYLEELVECNLNITRLFTGIYRENFKSFNISCNTLAPDSSKYICPWRRSSKSGYYFGGNKFDLNKWDNHYFKRLKDFVAEAGKRGIIVEVDLFSNFYDSAKWTLSPLYIQNNINGIGNMSNYQEVLSLKHKDLLEIQEDYVKKVVSELKNFDNVYYEICNEPYFGDLAALNEWQKYMTDVVVSAEKGYRYQHLISHNVGNGFVKIENSNPNVSIFNFHYASPPTAVELNYGLKKVIGDNETGFVGVENKPYRIEAWDFIFAGGGLFNHLDYSFTSDFENGTWPIPPGQPGGGGKNLRVQFKILRDFINSFDYIKMSPQNQIVKNVKPMDETVRVLSEIGRAYAIYINSSSFKGRHNFSLRWKTKLQAPVDGRYLFHAVSDEGVRLSIDNKLIIDNWKAHSSMEDTAGIELKSGQKYDLKLEYYQGSGNPIMDLLWTLPGKKREAVSAENFFLTDTAAQGLKLEYYSGTSFDTLKKVGYVDKISVSDDPAKLFENFKKRLTVIKLQLPAGKYLVEWHDTKTGEIAKKETLNHSGGDADFSSPLFLDDIALKIIKSE